MNDNKLLEKAVFVWLRTSTLLSGLIIGAGIAWALASGGTGYTPGQYPIAPSAIAQGLAASHAGALIALGLALLVGTPLIRVCIAALAYAREGEWRLAAISVGVLAILLTAAYLGAVG